MRILSVDLLDMYVHLNRQISRGNKWAVYNQLPVFTLPREIMCFPYYGQAHRYIQQNQRLSVSLRMLKLAPLFHTVTAVLLQKNTPPFIDTHHYLPLPNHQVMNTKNLDYLQDSLKYLGFDTKLNADLEKNIKKQQPAFQLDISLPHFKDQADYKLHFRKSDQSDMYFLNKMDASLKTGNPDKDKSQTFYLGGGNGVSAKEAYNMLHGRSVEKELVNKDGDKYKAWLQLDFDNKDDRNNHKVKQFHQGYGFDLEKTLSRYAIKELSDPEKKETLMKSLQRGNQQQITATVNGKESRHFIEASPQFKTINVFNEKMSVVKRETIGKEVSQEAEKKQGQKNDISGDDPEKKQGKKSKVSL
ncbi:hypothetical protein ADIARSV_0492 [Arcticibacter svalbardensis MN12-7]|uniref:DUF3945 domain-containing protein n=1 Tax=Arcticibacter svalbardensis MN12-7 TaxID=1150600 RepID=R9GWS3_9SPHI|nr:hypothetical protein [Arcticibacter svalbardensis]EOR96257.1 hypothetical protein ADIARSV_0492 [Arcticibacter svalbardensis MN12-7]